VYVYIRIHIYIYIYIYTCIYVHEFFCTAEQVYNNENTQVHLHIGNMHILIT
jgi:hypothetical protein